MNPSRTFIHRPIATSLIMIALLLSGLMAYKWLPVSALPEIDYPTIQVVTFYPGASPEVMTSGVTAPLERQFGQMPGLKQMTSTSSEGSSIIVLQFLLEISLDVAEQSVQAAINAALNLLPSDLPSPPVYNKVNPADPPVMTLAVTSRSMLMPRVEDMVDTRLAQKISQVAGVGLVSLSGGQRPAIRIKANMSALSSYGLSLIDLHTAVGNANVNQPKGSLNNDERTFAIEANDQLKSAEEYRELIVAYRNGASVRLKQVAEVSEGVENVRLAAWAGLPGANGPELDPAIILNIYRQPGANVIEVADSIKELLPQLAVNLPEEVAIHTLTDRTVSIRASISAVKTELFIAIALVIMVMYLFLRNVPATIIPAVAVPLSLIGTFGVMYLAGFSINNLTLMAMTIATGFVVDDAIVVIENISRYLEKGDDPYQAALTGSEQIGFTIISLTFSLVAVLIPLLFMTEVIGRLFREFAVTLAVSILISAAVSLTLTPMMCAYMLRRRRPAERKSGWGFDRVVAFYDRCLVVVLRHQTATLIIAGLTLLLTVLLAVFIPKGLFPVQDTGVIQAITQAPQSISFQAMANRQEALAKVLLQDPDVESLSSFIGVDGINTTLASGRLLINLKPLDQRSGNGQEIITRLKQAAASVSGIDLYMQLVQDLTIEDRLSRTQYQFTLEAMNLADLSRYVPLLMAKLAEQPALTDLAHDLQDKGLKAMVVVDRDNAARLGVEMLDLDNTLYNAFGQRFISTIFTQSNQYRVVLEIETARGQGLAFLENLYVPAFDGTPVPLGSLARVEEQSAYLAINRQAQFPSATISFNLAHGASLGQAVKEILAAESELGMPASIQTSFSGAALAFQASLNSQIWLVIAAVVAMYIVLGILYESAIHPITILSTLPSAAVGALLSLMLLRMDLGLVAIIGIILLIGIVKKNAIMMIDFALDAERQEGKTPREAIHQACLLRLRPILMTTFAALLGALPLMFSQGMGAELRQPLGVVLVGGLLLSQVLTLFTTPVIYLGIGRLAALLRGRRAGHTVKLDSGEP